MNKCGKLFWVLKIKYLFFKQQTYIYNTYIWKLYM